MIIISAVTKKHSRPWFMTPKRKAHFAKWKALKNHQKYQVNVQDMDSELERLGRIVSYEPKP